MKLLDFNIRLNPPKIQVILDIKQRKHKQRSYKEDARQS